MTSLFWGPCHPVNGLAHFAAAVVQGNKFDVEIATAEIFCHKEQVEEERQVEDHEEEVEDGGVEVSTYTDPLH